MRRAALLLLLAFAIGLYAWINVERSNAPSVAANGAANDDAGSFTASKVELIETGEDGLPRYRLQAQSVRQNSLRDPLALQQPRIDFNGANGGGVRLDWQLTASSGSLSPRRDLLEFSGEVQGRASGGNAPLLQLATSQLLVNTVDQVIQSSRVVELDWAGIHLTASGIRIELRSGVVKIGPGHGFQTP
jgi:LPS export ABC transporter protein LptC